MVPGLGGFMTHHVSSFYSENDHQMIPPLRTLGFNPKLKANDNLLAQSYVEAFDISYPEAMQRIEDEVGELSERLANDGSYTLNDIGTLLINEEGNIEFTPVKAGMLTPELYALDAITVKMLNELPQTKKTENTSNITGEDKATVVDISTNTVSKSNENNDDSIDSNDSIRIKVSYIRNIAAVAIALLGFFLFTSPLANGNFKMNMSNINTDMLYQIMPKTMVTEGVNDAKPFVAEKRVSETTKTEISDKSIRAEVGQDKHITSDKRQTVASPAAKKTFCLVMASHISKSNGDAFLEAVHKDGFTMARMVETNNSRKILYGEFDSEQKAYEELKNLHSNKYFKQAWVMEIK